MNDTHHHRTRAGLTAGAIVVGLAASLGLPATPAQASTTQSGCTVTPSRPTFAGYFNDNGEKMIRYRVTVTCGANRTVVLSQQGAEKDTSQWPFIDRDDPVFSRTVNVVFTSAGTKTVSYDRKLPDTESGPEEIYQKVLFRVTSNGVTSPSTAWETTSYTSFTN